MSFDRHVENKKEKIKKIEEITKKTKLVDVTKRKKNSAKETAMENAEMLFNLLHGKEALKKSNIKSRSVSHVF